jgi:hypothetical protein
MNTWRSVAYTARFFNRSPITIRHLCQNGTFAAFGIPTYKDKKGRYWICIAAEGVLQLPTD